MKLVLKVLGLVVGIPAIALVAFFFWGSAGTTSRQTYDDIVEYDAPSPAVQNSYTIVSYNIGYLSGLANNTTSKPKSTFFQENLARAISTLAEVKPDIIGFQEIDFDANRSYSQNQMQQIAEALEMASGAIAINWDKNYLPFPYWPPSAHFGKILSGQAVLSRYPIEKNSRIVLERIADNSFIYNAFYLDRLAQVSQISLDGRPVIVISVHLEAFSETTRVSQTQFVRSLAEEYAETFPVIVIGDFNSALNRPSFVAATGETYEERQFSIKEMLSSEQFASAVAESKWSEKDFATFPSNEPQYKLDYIFYTPNTIEVLDTKVLTAAGESSDHLPLMMQFRLK